MRSGLLHLSTMALMLLATTGCAEDLRDHSTPADTGVLPPPPPPDRDGATPPPAGPSHLSTEEEAAGSFLTRVDAASDTLWVYLDLDSGMEVYPETPEDDAVWDLAFSRFKIRTNGGISGTAGMEGTFLEGVAFGATDNAPSSGYVSDAPDTDDDGEDEDTVFNGQDAWYAYDPSTHVLTPRDRVYFVRSTERAYFEIQVTAYYDGAGTSGHPAIRWQPIAAPTGGPTPPPPPAAGTFEVNASTAGSWVYLRVGTSSAISVSDPESSMGWDLALSQTMMRTNGGTSGPGFGGAMETAGTFDSVSGSPTTGFVEDSMIPLAGPPGSGETSQNGALTAWYRYDEATHTVSARDTVFLIRTAAGAYAKLSVEGYEDGVYRLRLASVSRTLSLSTIEVDASSATDWVYLSFREGGRVEVSDAASDAAWDLGLSRTNLRTNGGTSGMGMGAAAPAANADLTAIRAIPEVGFEEDAMIPLPGPPGSGEISANAVLGTWFDYDEASHTVSPGDRAYVLRTADGGYVKLRVVEYVEGLYRIVWSYAGAGRDDFEPGE